jgi:hypothetical protein
VSAAVLEGKTARWQRLLRSTGWTLCGTVS